MKKILLGILWLILASSCFAASVKLAWDAAPAGESWTEVRAYEITGGTYTRVATVAGNLTELTIPSVATGTHTYVVRAYNGQQESPDSNSVQGIILTAPKAPTSVSITIIVP